MTAWETWGFIIAVAVALIVLISIGEKSERVKQERSDARDAALLQSIRQIVAAYAQDVKVELEGSSVRIERIRK